jgi:hypothetical protein
MLSQPNAALCANVVQQYIHIGVVEFPNNMKNYSNMSAYNFVYDTLDLVTLLYPLEKTC